MIEAAKAYWQGQRQVQKAAGLCRSCEGKTRANLSYVNQPRRFRPFVLKALLTADSKWQCQWDTLVLALFFMFHGLGLLSWE
jgi:transposase